MRFIHAHGLHLENNSWIENLRVPFLDKDPVKPIHGQIWYNTSENVFKGAFQQDDSIKILAFSDEEKIKNFVDTLRSTKEGEGADLIGFEGHSGANSLLSVNAGSVSKTLKSLIDAVDSDRKSFKDTEETIKKISDNFDQEVEERKSADQEIQKNLDDLKNNIEENYLSKTATDEQVIAGPVTFKESVTIKGNLYVPGGVTELTSNQVSIGDSIITLNSDIPSDAKPTENAGFEINRGSEGVMPGIIWDEANDEMKVGTGKKDDKGNWVLDTIATKSDIDSTNSALTDKINKIQKSAGLDTDGSYVQNSNSNYIKEAVSLADADNKLDSAIKANSDSITVLDKKIDNQNTELRKAIDGIRFIYQSNTNDKASNSYTVKHNLGTEFIDFTLWVLDSDNKWYSDLANVKIIDENTIEVDLSEAKHIRIVITNLEYKFSV